MVSANRWRSSLGRRGLERANFDLAELDGLVDFLVHAGGVLQRDRTTHVLGVADVHRLHAIERHREMVALGGDDERVPAAARLGHRRYLGNVDDSAGTVLRGGP